MVSKEIELHKLISVSRNFNVDKNENVLELIFFVGPTINDEYTGVEGDREIHVAPDQATIDRLKAIRNQIKSFLADTVIVEGAILEVWELQNVTSPESSKLERVKVQ